MPYVFSRPCWQNGRCGHSAGPASVVALPEPFAAKSDRVLRLYLSAVAFVTENAFVSSAVDGLPNTRLCCAPAVVSRDAVLLTSLVGAIDGSLAVFSAVSSVAAYSGTIWILFCSSCGR